MGENKLIIDGKEIMISDETAAEIRNKLMPVLIDAEIGAKRFAVISYGNGRTLLKNSDGDTLIWTWSTKVDLQDNKFFYQHSQEGHAYIAGQCTPFEITNKIGRVICRISEQVNIRFLKKEEEL